jgi:hypothetical protein
LNRVAPGNLLDGIREFTRLVCSLAQSPFSLGISRSSCKPVVLAGACLQVLTLAHRKRRRALCLYRHVPSIPIWSNPTQRLERGFLRPPPGQAFEVAPHLRVSGDLRNPRAIGRFGEAFLSVPYRFLLLARLHAKQTAELTRGFLPDAMNRVLQLHPYGSLPAGSHEHLAELLDEGTWNVRLRENRNGGEPLREHDAAVAGEKDEGDVASHCELAQAQPRF